MQEMWAWPWRNQEQGWASCPHRPNSMHNPRQGACSGACVREQDTEVHCGVGSEAEGEIFGKEAYNGHYYRILITQASL